MKLESPSHLLATATWIFVFVEAGLLFLRKIPSDLLSWGLFALFFLVAVTASRVANGKPKIKDIEVNIAGAIYSDKDGSVITHQTADGRTFVYVTLDRRFEKSDKIGSGKK